MRKAHAISERKGIVMNVSQIVTQAGDPSATLASYGNVPVVVQTSKGTIRQVTGARFTGRTLVLSTGNTVARSSTVQQLANFAGDPSANLASYGHLPVTVTNVKGIARQITRATFRSGFLVLVTGK